MYITYSYCYICTVYDLILHDNIILDLLCKYCHRYKLAWPLFILSHALLAIYSIYLIAYKEDYNITYSPPRHACWSCLYTYSFSKVAMHPTFANKSHSWMRAYIIALSSCLKGHYTSSCIQIHNYI